MLGDGDKEIEIVYSGEKIFCIHDQLEQPRQNKIYCTGTTSLMNHPRKALSFVLFESPFTSISTVSRGHPSLVSLKETYLVIVEGEQGRVSRVRWRWEIIEKGAEGPSGYRRYRAWTQVSSAWLSFLLFMNTSSGYSEEEGG